MAKLQLRRNDDLDEADFNRLEEDLKFLLKTFKRTKLREWMGQDKGNFSKRLSGILPITQHFYLTFYENLNLPITWRKEGISREEIELRMKELLKKRKDQEIDENPITYQSLSDRMKAIEERQDRQDAEIRRLGGVPDAEIKKN
jgi:hypothetical protein